MIPDKNIKKVVIPKSKLPSIVIGSSLSSSSIARGENFAYNIRYRIISEDKNRYSHWSRIHNVSGSSQVPAVALPYSYVKETATTSTGTTTAIRLNWTIPITFGTNTFDIFVKRNAGAYEYYGTSQTNTYVILREASETSITILVQTPTYPKEIITSAKLFETAAITVP
jgi:hypothetical protein